MAYEVSAISRSVRASAREIVVGAGKASTWALK
jgi:hypothetical protein